MISSSVKLEVACGVLRQRLYFAAFSDWLTDDRLSKFIETLATSYAEAVRDAIFSKEEKLNQLIAKPRIERFHLKKPKQLELLIECYVAPPPGGDRKSIGAVELMGDADGKVGEAFVRARIYLDLERLVEEKRLNWDRGSLQELKDQLTTYIAHEIIHLLDPKNRGALREHPSMEKYLAGPSERQDSTKQRREYYYRDPREKDAYIGSQFYLLGRQLADNHKVERLSTEELNQVIQKYWQQILQFPSFRRTLKLNKETDFYLEIPSLKRKSLRVFLDGVMTRLRERQK